MERIQLFWDHKLTAVSQMLGIRNSRSGPIQKTAAEMDLLRHVAYYNARQVALICPYTCHIMQTVLQGYNLLGN